MKNQALQDYSLYEMNIITQSGKVVSLLDIFVSFTIYTDIYLEFLTGNMTVLDARNIIDVFGISGGEEVTLKYQDMFGNPEVKLSFRIYNVSPSKNISISSKMYAFHLVSSEYYNALNMMQQGVYTNIEAHVLVNKLLKDASAKNSIPYKFISDIPSPVYKGNATNLPMFELIRKVVYSLQNNGMVPWIFYQTLYQYELWDLYKLASKKTYTSLYLQPLEFIHDTNIPGDRVSQGEWKHIKNPDAISMERNGNNSKSINYNPFDKNVIIKDFSRRDSFNKLPSIGSKNILYNDSQSQKMFVNGSDPGFSDLSEVRSSFFKSLEGNVINASFTGDTRLVSGEVVYMDVPSKESVVSSYNEDKLSGRFIIGASKHVLKKDGYITVLECMKDAKG